MKLKSFLVAATIAASGVAIAAEPAAARSAPARLPGFNASQPAPKHHGDALDDALEARLLDALRKESSLDQD